MATREVIVLDQSINGGNLSVLAAYWLVAPTSRVKSAPAPSAVPVLSATTPWGITDAEAALLRAGTIVEQVVLLPLTGSGQTLSTIQSALAAKYTSLQSAYTAQALGVPHIVGSFWDGTTWTQGP